MMREVLREKSLKSNAQDEKSHTQGSPQGSGTTRRPSSHSESQRFLALRPKCPRELDIRVRQ